MGVADHSPHLARAAGLLLGVAGGWLAGRLADVLPRLHRISPLVEGRQRTRRNVVLALLGALCGSALVHVSLGSVASAVLVTGQLGLLVMLLAAAAIDLEHMVLPHELTLGGAAVAVALGALHPGGLTAALLGVAVALAISVVPSFLYRRIRGHAGAGFGDTTLTLFAGAWFGPLGAVWVLFAGAVQVVLGAWILRLAGRSFPVPESVRREMVELHARAEAGDEEARELLADDPMAVDTEEGEDERASAMRLPMGPFLVLACLEFLFFGDSIARLAQQLLLSK
ncbi:Leader peptidase (Prepilin peptidase) [Labilithrix luteola]|uniref:Leader peptidase (Prepilin peptidase) n=1 Tax=Labilithrix luteola TaxID=1391654 RepID=A0A0K1PL25_9BACT|nr:prepilin peptidase [Labilithrix luteola]AKU94228.1 Leader peptidase (Prepilin peptidase) [Labilithrix luteola]